MDEEEIKALASAWIQHEETSWAWKKLHEIVDRSHDEAWLIIEEILKQSENEDVIDMLGVGPLEEILSAYADHYLDVVERLVQNSPNFRKALLSVRITGPESEGVAFIRRRLVEEAINKGEM